MATKRKSMRAGLVNLLVATGLGAFAMSESIPSVEAQALTLCPVKNGDKIVFAGDSITKQGEFPFGFVTLVEQSLNQKYKLEYVNAGVGGNTSVDLLARFKPDVLDKKPNILVLYIGINDIWGALAGHGVPQPQTISNVQSMVSQAKKENINVIICTPTVIYEKKKNHFDAELDSYAAALHQIADTEKVNLCDLRTLFRNYVIANNGTKNHHPALTTDGVHMTPQGNKLIADMLLKTLGQ